VAREAAPQPQSVHAAPHNAHAKRAASEPRPVLAEDSTKAAAKPSANGELFDTAQPAVAPAQPRADAQKTQTVEEQAPEAAAKPEPPQPAAAKTQAKATPQDDARLEREMAMLAVAQRVLQSDPARSLALARQGEAEFAGSMFTQERQQVLLLALVKLGRMDEARQLAKPYLARYPHGPFSDRVRRALATGKVER
jgi:hypothetical protein